MGHYEYHNDALYTNTYQKWSKGKYKYGVLSQWDECIHSFVSISCTIVWANFGLKYRLYEAGFLPVSFVAHSLVKVL